MAEPGLVHFRTHTLEPRMRSFNLRRHPKHPFHAFVEHHLDNSYPIVQVWDIETGQSVSPLVQTLDCNTLVVIFGETIPHDRYAMTVYG